MEIIEKILTNFHICCESTCNKKVLLNICDYAVYGLTDSNQFYRNYYVDQINDYNNNPHPLGSVIYTKLLSYHILANMSCVVLPKTVYNLNPFKIEYFKKCCDNLINYIKENNIEEIHTPVFGTKILEGDWSEILSVLNDVGNVTNLNKLYIYKNGVRW